MRDIKKILKESHIILDIINVITGIALIVFLILAFVFPNNFIFFILAFLAAGIMNILNGIIKVKRQKKKALGFSFIGLGAAILVAAVILFIQIVQG